MQSAEGVSSEQVRLVPRRSNGKRKRTNVKDRRIANIARNVATNVLKNTNELKAISFAYNDVGGVSFASIGYGADAKIVNLPSFIAQGTQVYQRVGNTIRLKRIKILMNMVAADSYNNLRVALVLDKAGSFYGPNVTVTQAGNLIWSGFTAATQVGAPIDEFTWKVLDDRFLGLAAIPDGQGGYAGYAQSVVSIDYTFPGEGVKFQWGPAGINRTLFFATTSDSSVVPNPGAIAGSVKMWFYDS